LSRIDKESQEASMLHKTLPGRKGFLGSIKRSKKDKSKAKPLTKWGKVRKWGLRSALALTVLAVMVGGFLVFKGIISINKVFKGGGNAAALERDVRPELLKGEGDGRVNILLLGKG